MEGRAANWGLPDRGEELWDLKRFTSLNIRDIRVKTNLLCDSGKWGQRGKSGSSASGLSDSARWKSSSYESGVSDEEA